MRSQPFRWSWVAFAMAAAVVWIAVRTYAEVQLTPGSLPPTVAPERIQPQIADRAGVPLAITFQNDWNLHQVVRLHEVPELLWRAFIEAEDQRFFQHRGVDWLARAHALFQNLRALRVVRGASTITEQVVRILHPRPRSVWSRWLEGVEAAALEKAFTKAEILEFYLNQVPYTRQRRGVAQAAQDYFGRDLDTLSEKEMLALAVLVRGPSRLDPRKGGALEAPLRALGQRLTGKGIVTTDDLSRILEERLGVAEAAEPLEAGHFVQFVRRRMRDRRAATRLARTTLDGSLQRNVQRLLERQLEKLASRRVGDGAAVVVDHRTDEILAWVNAGGLAKERGGHIDKILVPRQPGSALKPFVYAVALERGWTAATLIDDSPTAEAVGHGLHRFRNYSRRYYGPVRVREALGNSLNVPAVKAVQFTGRSALLGRLRRLGFESLTEHSDFYGDGLALGNGEVTLYELVRAYTALARGGTLRPLRWDADGVHPAATRRVLSAEASSLITHILSDPEARRLEFGARSVLSMPFEAAVKTGTSNDYRDAWTVGFTSRYTVGVWMGNVDQRPMRGLTGSLGPALVVRGIFAELHRYTEPGPLYLSRRLIAVEICRETGERATADCPTADEWFRPEKTPDIPCRRHGPALGRRQVPSSIGHEVRLESPTPGLHLALDPRIPDEHERFAFRVAAGDEVDSVEWIVDREVVGTSRRPDPSFETFLWKPTRGRHTVEARAWMIGVDEPVTTPPVAVLVK